MALDSQELNETFHKLGGVLCWGPFRKASYDLRSILGAPIFGNSKILTMGAVINVPQLTGNWEGLRVLPATSNNHPPFFLRYTYCKSKS